MGRLIVESFADIPGIDLLSAASGSISEPMNADGASRLHTG